jgi:hypothetical protein
LPTLQLVADIRLGRPNVPKASVSLARVLGCLTDVSAEGQLGNCTKQVPNTPQLVVGKCIHGVEKECAHAGRKAPLLTKLRQEAAEDREEVGLGLSASGPGCDDGVLARLDRLDGPLLV